MRYTSIFLVILGATACAAPAGDGSDDVAETPVAADDALSKAKNDLTAAQQKEVLGLLDDACGDAWCEGDYDWQFKKMTCDFAARSCTLTVYVTDPGTKDGTSDDKHYSRACKMAKAGAKYEDLVEKLKYGSALTDGFFQTADTCISKLESGIPH